MRNLAEILAEENEESGEKESEPELENTELDGIEIDTEMGEEVKQLGLRPGTAKFAVYVILVRAGRDGMSIKDIVNEAKRLELLDWKSAKRKENSILRVLSNANNIFKKVANDCYALRAYHSDDFFVEEEEEEEEEEEDDEDYNDLRKNTSPPTMIPLQKGDETGYEDAKAKFVENDNKDNSNEVMPETGDKKKSGINRFLHSFMRKM